MGGDAVNVLVVVLEGARADHIGHNGAAWETTPYLDQVARQGVRFTRAYTTAPAALPAHASLLSGLFACAHGATEESGGLGATPPLLSEALRDAGYRTAAFYPSARGGHPAAPVSPASGCGRGFERFYTGRNAGRLAGAADYARRASDRVLGRADAGARRTTHALLEWLRDAGEPFGAVVTLREATLPQAPPAPYDRQFAGPDVAPRRAQYAGALRYLDLRLQEIGEALAADGRWDRTLLVVTGTGGLAFDGEAPLCEATLRVPLILRAPGRVPAGYAVDEIAQLSDVLPTVLALTGAAPPPATQGRALLAQGAVTAGPRHAFAESYRREPQDVRRKVVCGPAGTFVWQSDEANAYFDAGDPHGTVNRVATDVAGGDRLRRRLFDWLAEAQRGARGLGADAEARLAGSASAARGG
ncbi:MAG: sulfatase [Deltaproteobacteria bacterium]|nr:sulfatase [Deltaproteobacteria bacterium]